MWTKHQARRPFRKQENINFNNSLNYIQTTSFILREIVSGLKIFPEGAGVRYGC